MNSENVENRWGLVLWKRIEREWSRFRERYQSFAFSQTLEAFKNRLKRNERVRTYPRFPAGARAVWEALSPPGTGRKTIVEHFRLYANEWSARLRRRAVRVDTGRNISFFGRPVRERLRDGQDVFVPTIVRDR